MIAFLLAQIGKIKAAVSSLNSNVNSKIISTGETGGQSFTLSLPNAARTLIIFETSTISEACALIVITTTTGAVRVLELAKGASCSYDTSTNNRITISTSNTSDMYPRILVFSLKPDQLSSINLA